MPGAGAGGEVDLFERLRAALHRHAAKPAVEPQAGRLVLRGDPFWLDVWASAVIEALFPEPGVAVAERLGIERVADPAPHEVGVRIACSGSTARPPSPVVLMLLDAVVRLHGGRMLPEAGAELCLAWPKSRVVTWQSG